MTNQSLSEDVASELGLNEWKFTQEGRPCQAKETACAKPQSYEGEQRVAESGARVPKAEGQRTGAAAQEAGEVDGGEE